MWDYEHAYPGGPMVGPKFIRPLYPLDAEERGKTPSDDGKDILAVKRGIWRAGRWPGPASGFDDTYSNGFSHGKGGDVIETGMAGFQRQMKIDATGWMGEATYNAIRSARIPEGLPNAGQPILDQTAIDLLNSFAKSWNGGGQTLREQALARAKSYLGYEESPPGTNGNMFGSWYGMNYEPWCAMFVSYCVEMSGDSPSFAKGQRYSYVPYMVSDALNDRNGLSATGEPKPGDLAAYDWQGDGTFDHVGFFEKWVSGRQFNAIEGNTSTSNDSNGGQVMRRTRDAGSTSIVFIRYAEP